MTTTKETPIATGEITNQCTCVTYDEDTGNWKDSPECWGDCWTYSLEDFAEVTKELQNGNDTGWWNVKGLRLWDGEVGGLFPADDAEGILRGMTVRSDWHMRYEVYTDRIEYSLSHHDAPMGSSSTLRSVTQEQHEEWGL